MVRKIKDKKTRVMDETFREKNARGNRAPISRSKLAVRQSRLQSHLESIGMETGEAAGVASRRAASTNKILSTSVGVEPTSSRSRLCGRKRLRSESVGHELARSESAARNTRVRSASRGRSVSVAPGEGFKNNAAKERAGELARKKLRTGVAGNSRKGDADRHVPDLKPKHLNSGKRGIGKNDRR
jgi:hypothetical protein